MQGSLTRKILLLSAEAYASQELRERQPEGTGRRSAPSKKKRGRRQKAASRRKNRR